MPITYEVRDRVAVLTIDNPPVNALAPGVWKAVDEAVARAAGDAGADAIVLIGAGTTFIAGADIKIFETLKTREQSLERSAGTHALLKRIEDAPKPLVAAIHGNALGGGLEMAMACHYRVATKDASVGQPEVLLGIIPGAGGTQRLPRLCGVEMALVMCTDGKPVSAPKAQAAGIIDQVVDGTAMPCWPAPSRSRRTRPPGRSARRASRPRSSATWPRRAQICAKARPMVKKGAKGAEAPFAAVDAIEAGLGLPFDDGSLRERELFADCVVSDRVEGAAPPVLRRTRSAKVPDVPKDTPAKTSRARRSSAPARWAAASP